METFEIHRYAKNMKLNGFAFDINYAPDCHGIPLITVVWEQESPYSYLDSALELYFYGAPDDVSGVSFKMIEHREPPSESYEDFVSECPF